MNRISPMTLTAATQPFLVIITLLFAHTASAQLPTFTVADPSPERLFAYTNGQDAFYCGVVNGENTSGFHGITKRKQKIFEDYRLYFGNTMLDRRTATTTLTPAGFVRAYPAFNTREEVTFADSLTLLVVRVTTDYTGEVLVIPAWSTAFEHGTVSLSGGRFAIESELVTSAWTSGLAGRWEAPDPVLVTDNAANAANFSPIMYAGTTTGPAFTFAVEFVAKGTPAPERDAAALEARITARADRIAALLAGLGFWCSDAQTTSMFQWIAASMDAAVMNQSGPGLYAGLPWFDDYWGRDTFIAMQGGLLATGRFETAKAILKTFADFQNTDPASTDFGRIPNRVTPGEMQYNTVDGTPWFVRMVHEYIRRSGDTRYAAEILPVLARAIDGARRYHTDAGGLMTHADADTWMDAVGPAGPWSPRGSRAVEVQALWIDELEYSAAVADLAGDAASAKDWRALRAGVEARFLEHFVDPATGVLADRLTSDGTPDRTARPNALFAIDPGATLHLPERVVDATLRSVVTQCVYPYGVASLAQTDSNFHPYHQYPQSYPKDAAYHNGTVWTWLTGRAVSAMCHAGLADSAWTLTRALETLALTQGAVGTLPECTDALARPGDAAPRWSGTFSQTWSDAEYLRNIVEDYCGISCDATASPAALHLAPRLPAGIDRARIITRVGDARLEVSYDFADRRNPSATVRHISGSHPVEVSFTAPGCAATTASLAAGRKTTLKAGRRDSASDAVAAELKGMHFCQPGLSPHLKAMRAPDWPLLDGPGIARQNPQAQMLWSGLDPEGDDTGPAGSSYTYPLNPLFKPGIFDIRGLTVTADRDNLYVRVSMRALVQPGWHPEYGFQLTELALAVRTSSTVRERARHIGVNAKFDLPETHAFDRLIVVGGGVQIQDAAGKILAAYIPVDAAYPLGNAVTGMIIFSLPIAYFGVPDADWRFALVAGGQDDHGGAGIGEFRAVGIQASEWFGGGNINDGPNVYDVLLSE